MKRNIRSFIKTNEIQVNMFGQLIYTKQFANNKVPQHWRFLPELYTNSQGIIKYQEDIRHSHKENGQYQNLKSIYDI